MTPRDALAKRLQAMAPATLGDDVMASLLAQEALAWAREQAPTREEIEPLMPGVSKVEALAAADDVLALWRERLGERG